MTEIDHFPYHSKSSFKSNYWMDDSVQRTFQALINTVYFKSNHPSLDTPQKKNQKTHLGDPKIYQVEGMDIPKQEVAKFS